MEKLSLLEQQRAIFSASSNTSRREYYADLERFMPEEVNPVPSFLETAPEVFLKPQSLEDSSSFGNTFKAAGAVPFKWEAEPGKPKSGTLRSAPSSLQPPPSISRNSSQRSSPVSLSPVALKLSKNSSGEHRSSPVSILEGFGGASPGSSPGFVSQVESPVSSSQIKKQLSLEIWDRSMRESSSSSSSRLSFIKHLFLGCWHSPKSRESSLEDRYYTESRQHQYPQDRYYAQPQQQPPPAVTIHLDVDFLHSGELERFREEYCAAEEFEDGPDENGDFSLEDEEDEVHAVNHGDFTTLPVSAAFVFSKPALKKARVPHNKRVRFLIEDYSSNEDDGEDDVCEGGSSSDNEGFHRPARVIIRRRKKRSPPSIDMSSQSSSSSTNVASDIANDEYVGFSPDLQPMEMFR